MHLWPSPLAGSETCLSTPLPCRVPANEETHLVLFASVPLHRELQQVASPTLSPAIPNFPEAASLTEPIQTLLFYELQYLRLNFLSQLSGDQRKLSKQKSGDSSQQSNAKEASMWGKQLPCQALTQWVVTESHLGSSSRTGAAAGSQSNSGCAACS